MRRRPLAALLVMACTALLAGCASIPTSGDPQQPPVIAASPDPDIFVRPNPPQPGASEEDIVNGFVQAASEGGGYRVARMFLTTDAAAGWRPSTRVIVHQQALRSTTVGDRVRVSIPVTAEVDATGVLDPGGSSVPLEFGLQQVRGQWRIAEVPDAVVLAQVAFQRIFRLVQLQFWDPAYQRFVPDARWVPTSSQDSSIVAALISGPSGALAGGVTASAFPVDARLQRAARSAGTVTVSIETGADPDARATDRMQQQIAASLVMSPSAVRLVVNGVPARVATVADVEQPDTAAVPAVIVGDRFGTLPASGFVADSSLGPRMAATRPAGLTVSSRQRFAAVLADDGRVAVVTPTAVRYVDPRRGLLTPTVDQRGWTYSVPADDPGGLRAIPLSGKPVDVETSLGGTRVISIEVSWDGARMLVLVATDRGPLAYVAGIERRADGTPIGLTADRFPVDLSGADASDATWIDPYTVGVLVRTGDSQTVVSQQLGGFAVRLGSLSNVQTIVGGSSVDELRALSRSQTLLIRTATGWRQEFTSPVRVQVLAVQR